MKGIVRKAALAVAMLLAVSTAQAQKIEEFKASLAVPAAGESLRPGARVTVREDADAADAVRRGDAGSTAGAVSGFRIVIFFDNGSTARADAEAAIGNFNTLYPDVYSRMDYENPYFKVLVGSCISSEEAIVLLGRITPNFPKAYITRENIRIGELSDASAQY